ncbi:protein-L-isoaspartate(D-aspartate) O-methyltransferase [Cohaesibacter sp. ES.047]|uniref:protein-L-isoaspartate O-methyltransferase family protein n=1 Tax=Cohaesibacter sp. ES.047 TaxID=1798205 RepID=UPI000BB79C17|nr:protein-L-isoaspartate O-methyltransferase [Cohaesibacter sp. ES.047]SNY93288.1 protein-L-isoaspartate(D-aspartate) O-methyltransferase [Cohaesibacter sp. ES.047]
MVGTSKARRQMVDTQIRTTDVTAYNVLDAFLTVPRELFVPSSSKAFAYSDADIRISDERIMMQPSPLAKLLQLADIATDDLVLVIAASSGYSAALVSHLANTVVAVENDEDLVQRAQDTISDLGYDNVAVISGDLAEGVSSEGPYDVILIEGTVGQVPQHLLEQLKDGGRLVTVDGNDRRAEAVKILRTGDHFSRIAAFDTNAPILKEFSKPETFTL